ncbi:type II toxin -antitoxin system TacA 1-like antitoxin [Rhizorhapis suberifaciens]|uniref:type II toxin -antitoxin system TacA 1-like antitoxin n=1 Tax=Rhizorhapis suberifaciens TaxID=13656 RepID=UPI00389B1DDF
MVAIDSPDQPQSRETSRECMKLDRRDTEAFLQAVDTSPAPTDRLIKAFERRKAITG